MRSRATSCGTLAWLAVALCACKDKRPAPSPAVAPAPGAPHVETAPPALADAPAGSATAAGSATDRGVTTADPTARPAITAAEALATLPALAGDVMIAPKATADGHQVHGTWCLPGSAADGVVHDLAATLTTAGWTSVTTRGDATKAGVSAERGDFSLSYVVSASSAATCRAPGHYFTSATIFRTLR